MEAEKGARYCADCGDRMVERRRYLDSNTIIGRLGIFRLVLMCPRRRWWHGFRQAHDDVVLEFPCRLDDEELLRRILRIGATK